MSSNGVVLYDGPSMINGEPIICVATGLRRKSCNSKTGALIHTWILMRDVSPVTAVWTNRDEGVCGTCPHRPQPKGDGKMTVGTCYVNWATAPTSVWNGFHRGAYSALSEESLALFAGRVMRMGAAGDPAAVPFKSWLPALRAVAGTRGYTHQWRRFRRLRKWCMASVDSVEERNQARRQGWRTFRVRTKDQPLESGEVACPASEEGGHRRTCEQCKACSGSLAGTNATPAIIVHGEPAKRRRFELVLAA